MISLWHLLWIVPLSASLGALCMAVVVAAGRDDHR